MNTLFMIPDTTIVVFGPVFRRKVGQKFLLSMEWSRFFFLYGNGLLRERFGQQLDVCSFEKLSLWCSNMLEYIIVSTPNSVLIVCLNSEAQNECKKRKKHTVLRETEGKRCISSKFELTSVIRFAVILI